MDNSVTLVGTLSHDPLLKRVGSDSDAISCRFTLGIERKWKDRRSGEDKAFRTFHEVICYRALATNVSASCRQGDAVVVIGRLNTRKISTGDGLNTVTEITADHVALNLSPGPIPID